MRFEYSMGGKSYLVSLLVALCILTSVVMAGEEPFCTSMFDFEEKLLHKVMRIEHAMELLRDEVTKDLTEFDNRQADVTFARVCCRCPDTWIRYKRSCYLFVPDIVNFAQAEFKCIQHETHLVKIDDADENAFLKTHSSHLKAAYRWIGLTDVSTEGIWKWRDGSNADFVGWGTGQPGGKREENCAVLSHAYQYDWHDAGCTERGTPICEKELTSRPPA